MSYVFNMIYGSTGGGSTTYAFIIVTYPAGSTCTASDGTTTLAAPDTSGNWVCKVPNSGAWTVSCTDGTHSESTSVNITFEGQSASVSLSYELYLFNASGTYSGTWEGKPWWASAGYGTKAAPTVSASNLLQLSATQSVYTVGIAANPFSFDSTRPTLVCTWQNFATSGTGGPALALSVFQPYADGFTRVINGSITTASGTTQLDISTLTPGGQYYFGFLFYKPAGTTISVDVSEVKLIYAD